MEGTNIQAAAFSVHELKEIVAESQRVKVNEPPPEVGKASNETVNGSPFEVIETEGVGLGNDCGKEYERTRLITTGTMWLRGPMRSTSRSLPRFGLFTHDLTR